MSGARFLFTRGVAVCALLVSCRAVPQAPEPPAPPPPTTFSLQHRFVQQKVFALRDSFVEGDVRSFMNNVSNGFYRGYTRLEKNFLGFHQRFHGVSLRVSMEEVQVEGEKATAAISWSLSMVGRENGLGEERRGESILIFYNTDKLRLLDFRGDPLFGLDGS